MPQNQYFTQMNGTTRLKIGDINKNLVCTLCRGYLIDATTIIECLHSFCRTCIVTYLKTSKTCPVCDTIVHKTRPHQNIRSDKLLQDLVYKLVPGLYKDEMRRRREFYTCHYEAAPKRPGEERGDEMSDRFAYTEEEKISLALYFCQEGGNERVDFRRVFTTKEDLKTRMEKKIKNSVDVRYLQCKAGITVGHLKKFVRLKYGLPPHFQVDLFYNDEPLRNSFTLCDIAYIFNWRRRAPLLLTFCVHESTKKQQIQAEIRKSALSTACANNQEVDVKVYAPVTTALMSTTNIITTTTMAEVKPSVTTTTIITTTTTTTSSVSTTSSQVTPCQIPKPTSAAARTGNSASGSTLKQNSELKPSKSKQHCQPKTNAKSSKSKSVTSSSIPVSSKASNNEQSAKTRTNNLGKRPANTPIPIAPAPAKIQAMNPAIMDLARLIKLDPNAQSKPMDVAVTGTTKLVSLLPAGMTQSQSSTPSLTAARVANKHPASTITFSVSSILNAVTNTQGMTPFTATKRPPAMLSLITTVPTTSSAVSTNTSPKPTFALLATPTVSSSMSLPPARSLAATPKAVGSTKASSRSQNHSFGQRQVPTVSSSSSSSSSVTASKSLSLPVPVSSSAPQSFTPTSSATLSSSSSSTLATVNCNQNVTSTSIASPTPAASASPIPAAVPVQQSQTQGSDILQVPPTPIIVLKEKIVEVTVREASTKTLVCQKTSSQTQGKRSDAKCISNTHTEVATRAQAVSQNGTYATESVLKTESINSTKPATSATTVTFKIDTNSPPPCLDSSTSSTQSPPELNGCCKSPIPSPTCLRSNGASGPVKKPAKQKKIADIANTLHKRMSETLLNQVGKRSSSPSNRRPGQSNSPGLKSLNVIQPASTGEVHDAPPHLLLNRHDMAVKESLQNVPPPNGLLRDNGVVADVTPGNQTEEPLNLVKRDKDMVRLTPNGMFILDIPPTVK